MPLFWDRLKHGELYALPFGNLDLKRIRFKDANFGTNPAEVCASGEENRRHDVDFSGSAGARQTEIAYASRLGKQCGQDVGNKIDETVTDHVRHEIAAPQIESGQD